MAYRIGQIVNHSQRGRGIVRAFERNGWISVQFDGQFSWTKCAECFLSPLVTE